MNENLIDQMIQNDILSSTSLLCMNIEPQLEKIMSGDFSSFERNNCILPPDLILHWAWEAWRLAIGPEIKKHFPNAVYLMNLGAQNNGKLTNKNRNKKKVENIFPNTQCFFFLL